VAELLDQLKEWIVRSVGTSGYIGIFVLMALESACIPIPSEVTMPVGGLLAAEGKLSFFWVGMVGALANVAGSWAAYFIGASGGRPLLLRYGRYLLIRSHDVYRADRWFDKHGEATVFFSRLLPVIRTFISLPAGVARMPFARFTFFTFVGCLPWSFALAYAGFILGRNWERILPYIEPISYGVAAAIVLVAGAWLLRRAAAARRQV
jgi:membrane protein DedA with SNARE-associated domain